MSETGNESAQLSSSESPPSIEGNLWDVQDILAERETADGESEVLVVWKPSWIPKINMQHDGPVMRSFRKAFKARFDSGTALGTLILPVEPGTKLALDGAAVIRAHADKRQREANAAVASALGGTHAKPVQRQTPQNDTTKFAGGISKNNTAAESKVSKKNP
jgi:hypothetical protein